MDIERLERLCHVRACMIKAREYTAGKLKISRDDMTLILNDGIDEMTKLILEEKHAAEN